MGFALKVLSKNIFLGIFCFFSESDNRSTCGGHANISELLTNRLFINSLVIFSCPPLKNTYLSRFTDSSQQGYMRIYSSVHEILVPCTPKKITH